MANETYVPLATFTLTGNDGAVTISNIPNIYRDLVLVTNMYASEINEGYIQLNGSSSGFTAVRMLASSSGVSAALFTTNNLIPTQTAPAAFVTHFFDYAQTNKQKTFLMRHGRSDSVTSLYACRWGSTAAINSITLHTTSPFVFIARATFSLYGISTS